MTSRAFFVFALVVALAVPAVAQEVAPPGAPISVAGIRAPESEHLTFAVDLLVGYGDDRANATLGFERQGRVGYAILTALGRITPRLSYRIAINPVEETSPRPACGASDSFYPNNPKFLYGEATDIPCDPRYGNRRVDAYRSIALDVMSQQGALREGYVDAQITRGFSVRAGRMRLPFGFDWQEAGAMTAKDAMMIQRINAQSNFGLALTFARPADADGLDYSVTLAGHLGDSNRWFDYDYFYFEDGSFGTNSQMTFLASGRVAPARWLDIRASFQRGETGSKVERLPSYWASKRNDDAAVLGVQVKPTSRTRVIVERARYVWGPRATSAQMLGLTNLSPIVKNGYTITGEAAFPINGTITMGGNVSYERIDRADSLVRWLASQNMYNVTMGRHDERMAARLFFDFTPSLRVGFFRTLDRNPFPWVSGIAPVSGPNALRRSDTNKWGLTARITVK